MWGWSFNLHNFFEGQGLAGYLFFSLNGLLAGYLDGYIAVPSDEKSVVATTSAIEATGATIIEEKSVTTWKQNNAKVATRFLIPLTHRLPFH